MKQQYVQAPVTTAEMISKPVRENILGTYVSALNMEMALEQMDFWIKEGICNYICVTPAHSIMDGYHHSDLRAIFNASGMTVPDGMAVVWLLKMKGHQSVERVYGPDLLMAVCEYGCNKDYRHYFYGGASGVTEKLIHKISTQIPRLKVAGAYSPPFRPLTAEEDEAVINAINSSEANILWVGLGSPKQEIWMDEHLGRINVPVMVGVGAAFDFLSGNKPQAPLWMQRNGFEWMFRFLHEPKRLYPRYRQYPKFVFLAMLDLLGLKKFYPDDRLGRQDQ
ncbi:WecB/TagA/CpsF family glycosyltransferase [Chloroflexota bacterium]